MLVDMAVDGLKERGKDPENDEIKYCWHYSQATVTDQNSWQVEGEKIIAEKYPNWTNVYPDNYYSEQDAEKAITVGEAVLDANPDIDVIICNDSTALPGQLQAAEQRLQQRQHYNYWFRNTKRCKTVLLKRNSLQLGSVGCKTSGCYGLLCSCLPCSR